MKKRIAFIDLAKGICISLIVLTHVNTYYNINASFLFNLDSYMVALFFIISGMFFKQYDSFKYFLINKINSLLVPFFFWYLTLSVALPNLLCLVGYNVRNVELLGWPSLWNFIFYDKFSNSPIWFLLCLFWMHMIFYLIQRLCRKLIIMIILSIIMGVLGYFVGILEIQLYGWLDSALTATPFFCFGYLINMCTNISQNNKCNKYLPLYLIACCIVVYYISIPVNFVENRFEYNSFFQVYITRILGALAVLLFAKYLRYVPLITYWGKYSLIILCLHMPVIQVVVLLVNKLNLMASFSLILVWVIVMLLFLLITPIVKRYLPYVSGQKNLVHIKNIKV